MLNMLHSIFIVKQLLFEVQMRMVCKHFERDSISIIVCFTKESKHCNNKVDIYICIFLTL